MTEGANKGKAVVIGAGFTGLTAAYELAKKGISVTVLEQDSEIGGLAGSFQTKGQKLDKFYHHCFNNDQYLINLVKELGCEDNLLFRPTRTGIYVDKRIFKLCTPLDVLRFKPLSFLNRIRLGLLVLKARKVKDFKQLESLTAEQWLIKQCGQQVYNVVWQPLLRGKFGSFASQVSATWFWGKLVLRGGSRSKGGKEELGYYRGSFGALAEEIEDKIKSSGSKVETNQHVEELIVEDGRVKAVRTKDKTIEADTVIATTWLPTIAKLVEPYVTNDYLQELRKIKYLANICLVLELSGSLSEIYWLNVTDAEFPFVGLIEHTNFHGPENYGGNHIIFLSKYLLDNDQMYNMDAKQLLEFSLSHIKRMFGKFDESMVKDYHLFKAPYAQPIVVPNYSKLIPKSETPIKSLYIASMAQIYPEDRGINYAIRQGQNIAKTAERELL